MRHAACQKNLLNLGLCPNCRQLGLNPKVTRFYVLTDSLYKFTSNITFCRVFMKQPMQSGNREAFQFFLLLMLYVGAPYWFFMLDWCSKLVLYVSALYWCSLSIFPFDIIHSELQFLDCQAFLSALPLIAISAAIIEYSIQFHSAAEVFRSSVALFCNCNVCDKHWHRCRMVNCSKMNCRLLLSLRVGCCAVAGDAVLQVLC